MTDEPSFGPGDRFPVQFVWQLPEGDYIRAVFEAEVRSLDPYMQRYNVLLRHFVAGRQEASNGTPRDPAERAREYWERVAAIPGAHIHLAYEAADGRPLRLRLATLTGEHRYFKQRRPSPPPPDTQS